MTHDYWFIFWGKSMYKRIYRNEKYRLRNDGETSNDGDASTCSMKIPQIPSPKMT